jgi:hypothetical protein
MQIFLYIGLFYIHSTLHFGLLQRGSCLYNPLIYIQQIQKLSKWNLLKQYI